MTLVVQHDRIHLDVVWSAGPRRRDGKGDRTVGKRPDGSGTASQYKHGVEPGQPQLATRRR